MYTGGCLQGVGPSGGNRPLYDKLLLNEDLPTCIFDFRMYISDKVKIHADPCACIFDVVYFEWIKGGPFSTSLVFYAAVGLLSG